MKQIKTMMLLGLMSTLCSINGLTSHDQMSFKPTVDSKRANVLRANDSEDGKLEDGETAEIYVNVDDPWTIDQILANVSAEDLLGEDVEVKCTEEEKAKYDETKLGVYTITITATDKYLQSSTAYLEIHVIDIVNPIIALAPSKSFVFSTGDTLEFDKISEYFTITDNGTDHGGTIGSPTYTLDGEPLIEDKVWSASDVGNHRLNVTVADSSGNVATQEFQVSVRDTQAPIITMKDGGDGNIMIGLSKVLNLSQEDFLDLFAVTDNVDSSESLQLEIEGEFIPTKVGACDVKVVCTDTGGNKGEFVAHVTVSADLPPVFVLSSTLVSATSDAPLTSSQIQSIITYGLYPELNVTSVLLDDTDYQENPTSVGSYKVNYQVNYLNDDQSIGTKNDNLTIRVTEGRNAVNPDDELSGWTKFWQCFKNWFRGVFTKFKFDCWITDYEWDLRFAEEPEEEVPNSSSTPEIEDSSSINK